MKDNIDLIIFGAQGDLSRRKLFPALYRLDKAGLLPDNLRIASIARHDMTTVTYLKQIMEAIQDGINDAEWDRKVWMRFQRRVYYVKIDFSQKKQFG